MQELRNILLIEPKKCDREVLPVLLKKLGLQTFVAENLTETYSILENEGKWHIDAIIISDETMDKQHLHFIGWLKKKHLRVKILAISCRASDEEICHAQQILFLKKPITDCSTIAAILKTNGDHGRKMLQT